MDRFQVALFDAFEVRGFLEKIERFCVHFVVFLCSMSHFVQDFEKRVVQDNARISEVVCALFSCEGWILQKLLLCVQEAEYSTFTLQFEQDQQDGSLLHLLSQSSYDFLRMLQQTPSFRPSEQFIVQLFGCIKQMLKYINHPTSTSVRLTEEQTSRLMSFTVENFSVYIAILAQLTNMDSAQQITHLYYQVGVLPILCHCVRLSITDLWK